MAPKAESTVHPGWLSIALDDATVEAEDHSIEENARVAAFAQ